LSNEERIARVKSAANELSEPFRSANLWIPDDTIINIDPIAYWVPIPFENHQGRITLCGDAAHPLPPRKLNVTKQVRMIETNWIQIGGKVLIIVSLMLSISSLPQ
jgi:hypothetical protein